MTVTRLDPGPRPEEPVQRGTAAYRAGDSAAALQAFTEAVERDPNLGTAWFYLGLLAYAREDWPEAEHALRRAITLGASVPNARHYLGLIPGAVPAPEPPAPATAPATAPADAAPAPGDPAADAIDLTTSPYGLYEALSRATDPLLRQPLPLIDALRMTRRASPTAFLHRFLGATALALLGAYVIAQGRQSLRFAGDTSDRATATGLGVAGLALALMAAGWIWVALVAFTTRYVIDRGRLQITSGVFNRHTRNLELYRVTDVTLVRTLTQRLTGDGSLHLVALGSGTQKEETFELTGLARADELEVIFQQLLNLVFALRANSYARGIIS